MGPSPAVRARIPGSLTLTAGAPSPAAELAALLRQLRGAAGLSQSEVGRRIGVSQSTIARFERGPNPPPPAAPGLLPTPDQVAAIAEALTAEALTGGRDVAPEMLRRLVELGDDAAEEAAGIVRVRIALQRGVANLQRRLLAREKHVQRMTTFHPNLVPGLVQTEAYIRAVAASGDQGPEETEDFVRYRLERQTQMAEPGRRLTVILTEGALMSPGPGGEVMVEQCDHLAELATSRPAWAIAVIPAVPLRGRLFYPPSGFDVYDDRQVFVGTTAGNALTSEEVVAAGHVELTRRLLGLAEAGPDAVPILEKIKRRYL